MERGEQEESEQKLETTLQESTKTRETGRNKSNKRDKANDRERSRMADIRGGFKMLRKCIPGKFAPTFKHLPKIQILRFAMTYISELRDILESNDDRDVDFSGKKYPVLKSTLLPDEETAVNYDDALSPPESGDAAANVIFSFDQDAISQFHPETNQTVDRNLETGSASFNPAEHLQTLSGYLTPNTLSPAPLDTSLADVELSEELQELLTPVSTQEEMVYLEDYLDEEVMFSPLTDCGGGENDNCFVCPDFSDLLTPTECDEILSAIV